MLFHMTCMAPSTVPSFSTSTARFMRPVKCRPTRAPPTAPTLTSSPLPLGNAKSLRLPAFFFFFFFLRCPGGGRTLTPPQLESSHA